MTGETTPRTVGSMTAATTQKAVPVLPAQAPAVARPSLLVGARAGLPTILGYSPLALFIGATVADSSVNSVVGWSGSWLIFSGTAHVVAIRLLDAGAALTVVIATAALVNLRLLVYGAGMAAGWRTAPRWFKVLGAYFIIDPSVALGSAYAERAVDDEDARGFYLGAAITMWGCWLALVGIGVVVGPTVAPLLPGRVVLLLVLVAMVIPAIGDRPTRTAAAVALVVALPASALPLSLGPFLAGMSGIAVAALIEGDRETR